MNAHARVLTALAKESDAVMSAETVCTLVNRDGAKLRLSTVKRVLRSLRSAGFVDAMGQYDPRCKRKINLWHATPEGTLARARAVLRGLCHAR